METQNLYLWTSGGLYFLSVVALSAMGQNRLGVYISFFAIIYFGLKLALYPKERVFEAASFVVILLWLLSVALN